MTDTLTPTDVLVGFVLDKSGSMGRHAPATIEGFNAFLDEQRALTDGTARLSLTLFNTNFETRHVALDVHEVPQLGTTDSPYHPHDGTALYDAVAVTIKGIEGWLANHPAWGGKVIIGVFTDGQENSSRQWSLAALNALIADKQAAGWEFAFLGTGGSAWTEGTNFAQTIGTHDTVAVPDSAVGVTTSFLGMSQSAGSTRSYGVTPTATAAYAAAETKHSGHGNGPGERQTVDEAIDSLSGESLGAVTNP